jgi:hypothetical protein
LKRGYGRTLRGRRVDGFYNDPTPAPEHQLAAVRTAVAMRDRFSMLASEWRKRGYDPWARHWDRHGLCDAWRIGFEGRYDYAAIGNVVNLAWRLSDAAGPGEILLSQRAFAAVEEDVVTEREQELQLKGFTAGRRAPSQRASRLIGVDDLAHSKTFTGRAWAARSPTTYPNFVSFNLGGIRRGGRCRES